MRLSKFRIRNYRRIEETDWIDVGNVIALVGGNETGKTSTLQALWKLKPARQNIVLDSLDEFPRRRYTRDYDRGGPWPVVDAIFDIDDDLQQELEQIDEVFANCKQVLCTNYYEPEINRVAIQFVPSVDLAPLNPEQTRSLIQNSKDSLSGANVDLTRVHIEDSETAEEESQPSQAERAEVVVQQFRESATELADRAMAQIADDADSGQLAQVLNTFRADVDGILQSDWQEEIWEAAGEDIQSTINQPSASDVMNEATDLIWSKVPVFIYFDDYNLLETEIFIPEAIREISAGSTDPKVRSQWALFQLTGLSIEAIAELAFAAAEENPSQEILDALFEAIRERGIMASAAGKSITEDFAEWWHQHRHQIDFRVDGETLQIWVADNKYNVPIEFDERSKGFRWFFTFFLVFTAETNYEHKNAVLLLDEPGLHLYPPAQEELLALFDRVSKDNQIIYSTHLPFLVDSRRLDRVRVVEELDDGLVRISTDISVSGSDVVFPVQAALGYQLAQTLFLARRVLIVEGETDYLFHIYLSDRLKEAGRIGIPDQMAISFAGGNSSVRPLLSMMAPQGFEIVVLLDSDQSGNSTAKSLEDSGFLELPTIEIRLLGSLVGQPDPFDLESLLPPNIYKESVRKSHSLKLPNTVKASGGATLSTAIKSHLKDEGTRLDKKAAMQWLIDSWRAGDEIPEDVLEKAEDVYKGVHEALKKITSR